MQILRVQTSWEELPGCGQCSLPFVLSPAAEPASRLRRLLSTWRTSLGPRAVLQASSPREGDRNPPLLTTSVGKVQALVLGPSVPPHSGHTPTGLPAGSDPCKMPLQPAGAGHGRGGPGEGSRSFQKGRFRGQSLWAREALAGCLPCKVVLMTFRT